MRRRRRGLTKSARQALHRLLLTPNHWVKGEELGLAHTGLIEGTRRVRELRAAGYRIEVRRPARHLITGSTGRWWYRIVVEDREQLALWRAADD